MDSWKETPAAGEKFYFGVTVDSSLDFLGRQEFFSLAPPASYSSCRARIQVLSLFLLRSRRELVVVVTILFVDYFEDVKVNPVSFLPRLALLFFFGMKNACFANYSVDQLEMCLSSPLPLPLVVASKICCSQTYAPWSVNLTLLCPLFDKRVSRPSYRLVHFSFDTRPPWVWLR